MNRFKQLLVVLITPMLLLTSCDNDLDQAPPNFASSSSLSDFDGVLNGAYYYQLGTVTPMAVMGDFRADNALMTEPPYDEFDMFRSELKLMEFQFFGPFYTAAYKSILSANIVIENSDNASDVGEARFLRALSYFKLERMFGEVPINLAASPSLDDPSILARQPVSEVYGVIIDDLNNAISALDNSGLSSGRASRLAAQALLGKVYVQQSDFTNAEGPLRDAITAAGSAGVSLRDNYVDIFGVDNDLNSEIIYATQITGSVIDEYADTDFWSWFLGADTKAFTPIDPDLVAAYGGINSMDLRFPVVVDQLDVTKSVKYPQEGGAEHDWIEIRLADVILLYAETLNENGTDAETVLDLLDPIRTRAGLDPLDHTVLNTKALVREAILDERRLELALEGHRWFDLVRTGTVDAEMGQSVNPNYYVAPIPISEISASFEVITQNPGY